MDTYQAKCSYCGAEQPIMAESQEAADEEMSNTCQCGAASKLQKQNKLMERIVYIAKGDYDEAFEELTAEQTKMLRRAGMEVVNGNAGAITYDFSDSKVRIWADGEKYKVSRTGTRKEVAEA